MMRRSVPGNRFSGSQSEKARGRGHCQVVRRLAAWFWERWISWARCWGWGATADAAFSHRLAKEMLERGLRRLVALNRFW
jgi:hypothetical protein